MKKNSLQKFTDFNKVKTRKQAKKLSKRDLDKFSHYLVDELVKSSNLSPQDGERTEELLERIKTIFSKSFYEGIKNQTWHNNHMVIQLDINDHLLRYHKMPSNMEISVSTGLTRQTVTKHLKDFYKDDVGTKEMSKFVFMKSRIISALYRLGMKNNDVRALKILLDNINASLDRKSRIQNNYIQINNTILNQESVENLNKEQLKKIEDILNKSFN